MIRLRPSGADEVLIKRVRDWYEPGPGVFIAPQALFNPALLFTTGVNGTWYDPSDFSTLFQDAAGTTPVTAVEQPVGLMLDKSKGLVLGSNIVTDSLPLTLSASGTVGTITTPTVGRWYELSYTVSARSGAGSLYVSPILNPWPYMTFSHALGSYKYILYAEKAETRTMYFDAGAGGSITFSNISVRELPGNHAFNSSGNSANFPVLSARYNLLTKTEDFSDAVWFKEGATVTSDSTSAPNGTSTADTLTGNGVSGVHLVRLTNGSASTTGYTVSIYVKAGTNNFLQIAWAGDGALYANYDISAGVVGTTGGATSATIQSVGNGWYRCVMTTTSTLATYPYFVLSASASDTRLLANTLSTTVYLWGADLRVANDALNMPAYQRVNTDTDYDTVGFKPYLKFNGTNQWLQTNSIDFSYGDKMFVCAGVRKLSDAATGILSELSATTDTNNGSFFLLAPSQGTTASYRTRSKGTATVDLEIISGYPAPITNVLSFTGNISSPSTTIRVNGTQVAQSTVSQGTGNYGNYPLYIGARAGSSFWFNGRLHQLIVVGKQASASEIGQTEAFTNQKTGAY